MRYRTVHQPRGAPREGAGLGPGFLLSGLAGPGSLSAPHRHLPGRFAGVSRAVGRRREEGEHKPPRVGRPQPPPGRHVGAARRRPRCRAPARPDRRFARTGHVTRAGPRAGRPAARAPLNANRRGAHPLCSEHPARCRARPGAGRSPATTSAPVAQCNWASSSPPWNRCPSTSQCPRMATPGAAVRVRGRHPRRRAVELAMTATARPQIRCSRERLRLVANVVDACSPA
jgi:hypothetical protein